MGKKKQEFIIVVISAKYCHQRYDSLVL